LIVLEDEKIFQSNIASLAHNTKHRGNIAASITNQYVVLLTIALLFGAPAGHFLSKFVIETAYAYHMPVDHSAAITAVAIMMLVLLLTASTQVVKVFRASPAEGLKME
jgi:membrane-associated phospholipid phosphatase